MIPAVIYPRLSSENQVPIVHYMYLFKGQEYFDDFGKSMSYRDFYHEVRLGEMPTTSQVNVHTFEEIFEKYIKEGYAVIYVSFSFRFKQYLCQCRDGRRNHQGKYAGADITVIDTKCAPLGRRAYFAPCPGNAEEGGKKGRNSYLD